MKFTAKTIYSIKLFIDLGEHYNEGYISLTDVSKRKDISKKFIEQIIPLYKNSGLIVGTRGNNGGYKLTKNPSLISLKDIIAVSERDLLDSTTSYNPLDSVLKDLDDTINDKLESIKLSRLIELQIEAYSNEYMI